MLLVIIKFFLGGNISGIAAKKASADCLTYLVWPAGLAIRGLFFLSFGGKPLDLMS